MKEKAWLQYQNSMMSPAYIFGDRKELEKLSIIERRRYREEIAKFDCVDYDGPDCCMIYDISKHESLKNLKELASKGKIWRSR